MTGINPASSTALQRLETAPRLWFFLDYDGTLADFAPTPDDILPDPELIALLQRMARCPRLRVDIISGRRLAHIRALVPVEGLFLAGAYGLERQAVGAEPVVAPGLAGVRPVLEALKPRWQQLLEGRQGFYLEDKGWTIAIHARFASDQEAATVLEQARRLADPFISGGRLRLVGGHKFLEISPAAADKAHTVRSLLVEDPFPGALPVYLGDDDKDEAAFHVIKEFGGLAVQVLSSQPAWKSPLADLYLDSPAHARRWLNKRLEKYEKVADSHP